MGSCFAVEIRNELRRRGFDVYPKYFDLPIVPGRHSVGFLPKRDNINHYDTFVIRQEVERAESAKSIDPAEFWSLDNHKRRHRLGGGRIWQDPWRRDVYASSVDNCKEISNAISRKIDEGIRIADVIIITLGLTEIWKNRQTGSPVCMGPRSSDDEITNRVDFHASGYQENLDNLKAAISAIRRIDPDKHIVLTVSPVALARTFRDMDVVVANGDSKSTLRAVAADICRDDKTIIYWPSFEFAQVGDIYEADGRHVKREAVASIISGFLDTHLA